MTEKSLQTHRHPSAAPARPGRSRTLRPDAQAATSRNPGAPAAPAPGPRPDKELGRPGPLGRSPPSVGTEPRAPGLRPVLTVSAAWRAYRPGTPPVAARSRSPEYQGWRGSPRRRLLSGSMSALLCSRVWLLSRAGRSPTGRGASFFYSPLGSARTRRRRAFRPRREAG